MIIQNIAYETRQCTAGTHYFIARLLHGLETWLGENVVLVSGGQTQRPHLARLARTLVLDECKSLQDLANATASLEGVRAAKVRRATVVVTHTHVQLYTRSGITESSKSDELMLWNGQFTSLARGGN